VATHEQEVLIYRTLDGRLPYVEWTDSLNDARARQKVDARIARLRLGNFGVARSVGNGVAELKIDYGPGYRVYFGRDGQALVILLCGGSKGTQNDDIKKAKAYWTDYQVRSRRPSR
jgi:putative addiction module killer protein